MIKTLVLLLALLVVATSVSAFDRRINQFFRHPGAVISNLIDRSFVEHTKPIAVPQSWELLNPIPIIDEKHSDQKLDLVFAVKHRNLAELEETFWAVSDPRDSRYGQHLTLEDISARFGPQQETIDALISWLQSEGIHDVSVTQAREYVFARGVSIATASRAFRTSFHSYIHKPSGRTVDASLGPYSVPSHIAKELDLVAGVVGFPTMKRQRRQRFPTSPNADEITPDVIRARYNITDNIATPNSNNLRAVAEFQAQYYSAADLHSFWNQFVTNAPYQDVAKIIGDNTPRDPGDEASLDVQYLMGVVPNITTWFYSLKSDNFWKDLLTWTGSIDNETTIPWVHSVSYGSQGDYPSESYRARLDAEFQKLGARGASIIFASGDSGAGCQGDGDEAACKCELYPSFPATCVYITSVGATGFITGNTGPEKAVMRASIGFKSGGGFSQEFDRPDYQKDAVNTYLNSGVTLPPACAWNSTSRATPDVSALGDIHFQIVDGGSVQSIGGTSASAPTFAAIVSLLNEQRLNAGKAALGFLNPWLYQSASSNKAAFFDVTQGDNVLADCCASSELGGFNTAPGWDPVTGVGSPNYAVLKNLI